MLRPRELAKSFAMSQCDNRMFGHIDSVISYTRVDLRRPVRIARALKGGGYKVLGRLQKSGPDWGRLIQVCAEGAGSIFVTGSAIDHEETATNLNIFSNENAHASWVWLHGTD